MFNKVDGESFSRADWVPQQGAPPAAAGEDDAVAEAADLLWAAMLREGVSFPELMRRVESELLQKALQVEGKTRREIAGMLHTSERTLYHKINSHRIADESRRAPPIASTP